MAADETLDHYSEADESTRLTRSMHGRLELLRTQELIRRFMPPPPARVLDVGGATGVHARWLASDGHAVHLIDPVARHVEAAMSIAGVTARLGDARSLEVPSASADAIVLLGPLYHLSERADRALALSECRRVLRRGGVLFAAAISRYLTLLEFGTTGRLSGDRVAMTRSVITSGTYAGEAGFVSGHWHTADELASEVNAAGFGNVAVFGIEGPTWPTMDAIGEDEFDGLRDAALQSACLVEQDPHMVNASAHLLAVATA